MKNPNLRFKGFNADWEKVKLSEMINSGIVTLHIDGNHGELYPRSNEFVERGVPYVSANALLNGKIDYKKVKYLSEAKANEMKKGISEPHDVIFAHNATVGPVGIVDERFKKIILSTTLTLYRFNAEYMNNIFIKNFMESDSYVQQYKNVMKQTTRNQVPITMQRTFSFPMIDVKEQEKIASFFNLLSRKIDKQQEKVELLKLQKKGLLQKIFSQEMRFKDENGQEYPEWTGKKLNEVANKITKKNNDFKITKVISNSAKKGLVPQVDYFEKNIANKTNIDGYYVISKGNFVYNPRISNEAPYGPVNIYNYDSEGIVSPLYLCFSTQNIDAQYLYYYFKSSSWYKHIYINGDSGARHDRVSIKDSEFFNMDILLPCLNEQEKIVQFLDKLEARNQIELSKLKVLKSQKQAFMQQMFI